MPESLFGPLSEFLSGPLSESLLESLSSPIRLSDSSCIACTSSAPHPASRFTAPAPSARRGQGRRRFSVAGGRPGSASGPLRTTSPRSLSEAISESSLRVLSPSPLSESSLRVPSASLFFGSGGSGAAGSISGAAEGRGLRGRLGKVDIDDEEEGEVEHLEVVDEVVRRRAYSRRRFAQDNLPAADENASPACPCDMRCSAIGKRGYLEDGVRTPPGMGYEKNHYADEAQGTELIEHCRYGRLE